MPHSELGASKESKSEAESQNQYDSTTNEMPPFELGASKESESQNQNDSTTNEMPPSGFGASTSTSKKKKNKKQRKKSQNENDSNSNEMPHSELGASKESKSQNPNENDSTSNEMPPSGLGATKESVPQNQTDIENASSLLATSQSETDESKTSKEGNEKIPLEVLQYLENVEKENQTHKETLESLKKPFDYMEKIMQNYVKLKSESEKMKVKNQELEDARLCKVCMEAEICFVFIPCGHICTCENCAVNGDLKNCPICREKITKRMKTFMP